MLLKTMALKLYYQFMQVKMQSFYFMKTIMKLMPMRDYSAIQMKWDNKHQTFTLFAPIGKMPPKLENRKFKIQIFTPLESGHVSVIEKDIIYNNKTMKLKF